MAEILFGLFIIFAVGGIAYLVTKPIFKQIEDHVVNENLHGCLTVLLVLLFMAIIVGFLIFTEEILGIKLL